MGLGRKLGKTLLGISRGADKVTRGMDMVFGEERTRPGDGFSRDRAGARAAEFTRQAREDGKGSDELGELDQFFESEKEKEKEEFF